MHSSFDITGNGKYNYLQIFESTNVLKRGKLNAVLTSLEFVSNFILVDGNGKIKSVDRV